MEHISMKNIFFKVSKYEILGYWLFGLEQIRHIIIISLTLKYLAILCKSDMLMFIANEQ